MITVMVVDDHTLVRQGIRSLLALSADISVIAEASDGHSALDTITTHCPDVILLDLRMPVCDGLATLQAMRNRQLATPTLILTTFDDHDLVLEALRAGASGYLLKDVSLDELTSAIKTLASGGTLIQPAITDRVLQASQHLATPPPGETTVGPLEPLTRREVEVLNLIASGYANREIAAAMHLAEGTVKNHVSSILLKLNTRDRTRAIIRALQLGILGQARTADPSDALDQPKSSDTQIHEHGHPTTDQ